MDNDLIEFAKMLRLLRKTKKLSQEKLAERCGMPPKYLQRLEKNHIAINPTLKTILRLAKGLNCHPVELVPYSGPCKLKRRKRKAPKKNDSEE